MAPFNETAALLYEGPWVAERYAAIGPFLAKHAREVHPVTRRIIDKAKAFSAADAFAGLYRLEALKRATEPVWRRIDALAVPTAPCAPTLAEVAADPHRSQLAARHLHQLRQPARPRRHRRARAVAQGRPRRRHHLHRRCGDAMRRWRAWAARSMPPRRRRSAPRDGPCRRSSAIAGDRAGRHAGACRGRRAPLRHGAQPRAARARRLLPARGGDRAVLPALRAAGRPAGASGPRARRRRAPATPSPPRCGRCRPRASAASSPASRPPLGIGTLLLADGTRPKGFLCESRGHPRRQAHLRFRGLARLPGSPGADLPRSLLRPRDGEGRLTPPGNSIQRGPAPVLANRCR